MMKFDTGQVVCTTNLQNKVGADNMDSVVSRVLARHVSGDWGDLSEEDKKANDKALKNGERIMSSYNTENNIRVWVITEWDRSVTTVLLPEDY